MLADILRGGTFDVKLQGREKYDLVGRLPSIAGVEAREPSWA